MKISIAEKETKIEGNIESGKVVPFGSGGAHIYSKKEHIGKNVNLIVPENPVYTWVLGSANLNKALKIAVAHIKKKADKTWKYQLDAIECIKSEFSINDLQILVLALKEAQAKALAECISKTYSL
jgi:putative transposon-encoded protein